MDRRKGENMGKRGDGMIVKKWLRKTNEVKRVKGRKDRENILYIKEEIKCKRKRRKKPKRETLKTIKEKKRKQKQRWDIAKLKGNIWI